MAFTLFYSSESLFLVSPALHGYSIHKLNCYPKKVVVTILNRSIVTCIRVDIKCPIGVGGKILKDDLIIFHLMEFVFIVRMDRWNELSKLWRIQIELVF